MVGVDHGVGGRSRQRDWDGLGCDERYILRKDIPEWDYMEDEKTSMVIG